MVRLEKNQLDDHRFTQMATNELSAQVMRQVNSRVLEEQLKLGTTSISAPARHYHGEFVDMTLSMSAVVFSEKKQENATSSNQVVPTRQPVTEVHRISSGQEKESRAEVRQEDILEQRQQRLRLKHAVEKEAAKRGIQVVEEESGQEADKKQQQPGAVLSSIQPGGSSIDLSALRD